MKLGSKPMGMHVEPSGAARLALLGALLAVLGSALVLGAVATGALVVPGARPAAPPWIPVSIGYGLPVLALLSALFVRRRPLVGSSATLAAAAAIPFVYERSGTLALALPLVVGAVVSLVGAVAASRADAALAQETAAGDRRTEESSRP